MQRVPRYALTGALLALAIAPLSACSPAAVPDPRPAAEALAGALATNDFSAVHVTGTGAADAATLLGTALEAFKDIPRTTTLLSVSMDPEPVDAKQPSATAVLKTVWDIDSTAKDWEYETTARLSFDAEADAWAVPFTPEMSVPGLETGQYVAYKTTKAARGEIRGADNAALVSNRAVVRIGINKPEVPGGKLEDSAMKLAKLVDIDPAVYAARVRAAGDKAFVEAIVLRDDFERTVTNEAVEAIPGTLVKPDVLPLAPTRSFARPILGVVGEATAEIVDQSKGTIKPGTLVGLSGVQAQYQKELAGSNGYTISTYSTDRKPVEKLFESPAVDGANLQLTMDLEYQDLAQKMVDGAGGTAALVAIRPSDGAVLAAASGPADAGLNTAMLGKFAPGSTFKVITALAMLRGGKTPTSTVKCPATTTVDGKSFKNYNGYPSAALGTIPLSEAIAQSCNTVFVNASTSMKAAQLTDAAGALGLAAEAATGAASFLGSVPSTSTGTELAANAIGQGVVEASALGMATVAASVAAGKTVSPHLVADPAPKAGTAPAKPLTAIEAKALKSMMAEVVDHGTLKDLRTLRPAVFGKSGTAEYDSERNAHAWVIAAQGDLAVAAFVKDGSGGAQTAGPLVKGFLTGLPK
ncbi:penicillin-binding transpeptidase domain-containing protein [Paeniglutamicibacter cryotolerans]|uniref:Cell division protein FtsI/penicillin-binding protein 2 n=1 Tax=Paeniglutamicibacter cryotolerans TaxID=670079 RepID=A0A839QKS4_9MICC|nr:penicillin-binding transpeptidase domain-containing protein [Paeniglutamicibacter cryotolerans]MBB2996213.1 cell division protein FtsI/penicillin-binding protein 2 [Paeniglutamicibacter cryotolerans]